MKLSFVVPTYCEEDNIAAHYQACMLALDDAAKCQSQFQAYEYLIIDNCSLDNTVAVALRLRERDPCIKILVNDRNYGPVLSPFHGLMAATGDVVLLIAADLQEPPSLLGEFAQAIADGYEAAIGYKSSSREHPLLWSLRGVYYQVLNLFMSSKVPSRFSGFGLYSRPLLERLRTDNHSEPSLRVLLPLYTTKIKAIAYAHQGRRSGNSSYSIYRYCLEAIRVVVRNSPKFPGLAGSLASLLAIIAIAIIPVAIGFKLLFWQSFGPGIMTLMILTLLLNSFVFAFMAIILDRLDQLLGRQEPLSRQVRQSAHYE